MATKKTFLKPDELETIKAACKILKKCSKRYNNIKSDFKRNDWCEELYYDTGIDFFFEDQLPFIDVDFKSFK